eukprot:6491230-Amphidinium_carterae.3
MDASKVIEKVRYLASVSRSLSKEEGAELACMLLSIVTVLMENMSEFLNSHAGPVLLQFSSDTTPVKTRVFHSAPGGTRKRKVSSKLAGDFLVQNVFLTAGNIHGGFDQCVVTNVPILLGHGKSTRAIAGCASSMPGLLMCRSGGALRFMLKHVVMDRGVSLKVARYLSGLWTKVAAAAAADDDDDAGVAGEDRWLMEIHTYVGCAAHDSHNALKWSLAQFYDESEVLINIHVALEALRVGAARAGVHLWDWLQSVLSVRPVNECADEEILDPQIVVRTGGGSTRSFGTR